jgi:putative drug exporter of the RND superfamily
VDNVESIARFVLAHRRWVFAFWLVIFLIGGATAGQLTNRLSFDFSLPGQPGYETELKLAQSYGVGAYPSYIPAFTASDGSDISGHATELAAVSTAIKAIPGLKVVDYAGTKDEGFITDDGKTSFSLIYAPPLAGFVDPIGPKLVETVKQSAAGNGLDVTITGYNQLQAGSEDNEGPSILVETLVGAGFALLVLVFVFASFLALVPLIIAAVSILATFLIVLGLTTITDVSFVVQFLISLVGLGVAIDYSLLVVSRWREEREKGADNHDAVVTAVQTAGHAVLASGVTVAISLIALVVVPVPLLRSMGFGGMLIPVVSTLVVLTLLPAMLGAIGPKVDWPRIRHEGNASRGWTAWARGVVRFRWIAAGVAGAMLAIAILPVFNIQFGQANSDSLAANGEAHDTLVSLRDNGVDTGILTPMNLLVKGGDTQAFIAAAEKVDGVRMAVASEPGRGGITDIVVVPDAETVDNRSVATVSAVQEAVQDLPGYEGIAGLGAMVLDYQRAVFDRFPYVLALIALVTFVLLVRTFRSILLPLKAVALNLISVAAVFGLSTWFWQEGNGSEQIFGIQETGAMTLWIPVLIFAFLFGLSMDYEVFILARMREEYDRTGSTAYAVEQGLGRTGRLVTSAALILFFAFVALASAPGTDIKVFATALGVGILLDATIVRALLVPALVSLFGKYNWWLPAGLAKVLRVEPSPLRDDAPRPVGDSPSTPPSASAKEDPVSVG